MKLALASEMRELDRTAIEEYHIPGMVLMENAGRGTFGFMCEHLGPPEGKTAILFTGPGNNGGDGLVIARCIRQAGGFPFLVFLTDPGSLKGDAALNLRIARKLDLPACVMAKEEDVDSARQKIQHHLAAGRPWAVVDAIFGTGLQRPVEGRFREAIRIINGLRGDEGIPVAAVDIPSGINSDTGTVLGMAVRADLTATYGLAKPGHFLHGGDETGRLRIIDIGIPRGPEAEKSLTGEVLDDTVLDFLQKRTAGAHKGNFGHLLITAGAEGKTGAAILCARGALRMGSGLVSLAVPAALNPVFETVLTEAMTVPLPGSGTLLTAGDADAVKEMAAGKSAIILGPGIGTADTTRELVIELYRDVKIPMVVDADALNCLAIDPEMIADPPAPRILTPHPGEMARLTGSGAGDIQADRLQGARSFTASVNNREKNVTLVLKGAGTVICDPGGSWAVNPTGNPGMAAGGMGDVLNGFIAGLLAQGLESAAAARLGVYLHGMAADRLAEKRMFGYLASEVADEAPAIMTNHARQSRK
jgi:NAD(P)H-hydrate epimerase